MESLPGTLLALLLAAALAPWAALAQPEEYRRIDIANRQLLSLLLERLSEPIFLPKGDEERLIFRVPAKYLRPRFQPLTKELQSTAGAVAVVEVPEVAVPDLGPALELSRYEQFSLFIPKHRRMARRLVEIFLSMPSYEDFLSTTAFCRERVNPYLFAYATAVAIRHRPDTLYIPVPNAACLFPQKYFDGAIFPRIRMEASVLQPGQREPIVIPRDWTATDLEPEHRVAYFREDVGINLCHWQWHLVYPFDGPRSVVDKNRRGELFYYFHEQIIARFNFERLSNHLGRVKRFLNWREPIEEAYFPKLDTQIASRVWPPRQASARLSDIQREDQGVVFDILDLERWRDRIMEAIHTRRVQTEAGVFLELDEVRGIDLLGNILESSALSVNRNLYGDLHNFGHVAISYIHDPDNRHLEPFAVMGDSTTAMRDPVFYRWHSFVQSVFDEHKATLPRYTVDELSFDGVEVLRVEVQTIDNNRPNEFQTFWQQSDLDISRGLDFVPRGPVYVRVTHLQHSAFIYRIQVRNTAGGSRDGTVRIFMAPLLDERKQPLNFRDQRTLFIELDKFRVRLDPGVSNIVRWFNQSSVGVPPERTFRNLDQRPPGPAGAQFDYCGCGWPQHMLIPKGSAEGLRAVLFVMVSDYADDQVGQPPGPNACSEGHSYCGILGQLYPDRRAMGYPMDRMPRSGVTTLRDFLTPNMAVANVLISHEDRVVPPVFFS